MRPRALRLRGIAAFMAAAVSLTACTQQAAPMPTPPPSPAPSLSPSPVLASPADLNTEVSSFPLPSSSARPVSGFEITGSGQRFVRESPDGGASESSGAISFNFVNADVTAVAQTIFGQLLKENYTVDGGVQGKITLQTTRPLSIDEVIPALETSLQMANLALTREADGYHIVPLAQAAQASAGNLSIAGGPQTPGYGYEIIPLKYANATAVQQLVQPLAQNGVQIQVDASRNMLIVAGSSQARAAIAENVAAFDVDWLAGMSYALVPLQNASAPAVVKEVNEIIGTNGSPMDGLVRLIVISQLNAILVVAPQARYLAEVRAWIQRLDQQQNSGERQVFIYPVQNGKASNIAAMLNSLLGQGTSDQPQSTAQASGDDASSATPAVADTSSPNAGGVSSINGAASQTQGGAAQNPLLGPLSSAVGDTSGDANDTTGADQKPRISADEDDNAVLVYATPEEYRSIQNALVQLDIQPKQVMIEAAVVEVSLTDQLQYGVQYFFQSGRVQSINTVSATNTLSQIFPGFSAILSPGQNIQVLLNALDSVTHINVLSAPKLMVLNNQPAVLQVGDEVPITTQTAQSTDTANAPLVSTIQYQNTGVILHVTPRINQGGLVTLDISQEVSEVSSTTSSTAISPTISERKISTIVAVPDGQTVALGGLIQSSVTTDNSGIPLLDRVPVLGHLFSNHNNATSRTELLVLITPHVAQTASALQSVTDALREELPDVQ